MCNEILGAMSTAAGLAKMLPDVHTHDKGEGVLYQTREPAGTADRYRHERDVALRALRLMREDAEQGWQAHDLTYHAYTTDEILRLAAHATDDMDLEQALKLYGDPLQ